MATPDIGKSVSEGYTRGFDRISSWLPSLVVVGAIAGGVAAIVAVLQAQLVPNSEDLLKAVFSGDVKSLTSGKMRLVGLLSAVSSLVLFAITFTAYAVYGGLLHRERHGEPVEAPSPNEIVGQLMKAAGNLMPKFAVLAVLVFVMQASTSLLGTVGSFLSFVALVVTVVLSVRWVYAPIIAGSGEATGDAAFERSQDTVAGNWLGTFGVLIVIGIATAIPFAIAAAIIAAIVPTAFLSSFASSFVITAFSVPIMASAIESAWSQVEQPQHGGSVQPPAHPDSTTGSDDASPFV
ncbi:MAG: hypothetical protein ABI200_07250 [Gaiellales bacterium]